MISNPYLYFYNLYQRRLSYQLSIEFKSTFKAKESQLTKFKDLIFNMIHIKIDSILIPLRNLCFAITISE